MKSKTMAGFDSPYVPGWDCHGLPIEIKVDQQLGGKKLQMRPLDVRAGVPQVRAKISRSAARAVQAHRGLRAFRRPYSTMTPQYESVVLERSTTFFEKDSSTRDCARSTGASTTGPPWPKLRSSTRTTPAQPYG